MTTQYQITRTFDAKDGRHWSIGEIVTLIVGNNFEARVENEDGYAGTVPGDCIAPVVVNPLQTASDLGEIIVAARLDAGQFTMQYLKANRHWRVTFLSDHISFDERGADLPSLLAMLIEQNR